jgi:3D-(3,5/4)-trihydroxycyclohexane-1,2-dione acylhydrolase (decyclizing)
MRTVRLTTSQAIIRFLLNQHVERDGRTHPFFAGCWGIFGHGNVAGIAQALQQTPSFPYYLGRNEQALAHTAAAFARMANRMQAMVCTSSVGPGATNMVTAAAGATINRVPLLLLVGDTFARRNVGPVLQQLESSQTQDVSVNDTFKPVSRYWDRIQRPEQTLYALPEAMRVLTSPSETGTATLALPQDVQAEAFDFPLDFIQERVWSIPRARADERLIARAASWIRASERPLIIAGGGVIYSDATQVLTDFASATGIPVAETIAGKGSMPFDHPHAVGAVGVTGVSSANTLAREADLVVGIGTRYSDLTTASQTAFQDPGVRFININVTELDAFKQAALPLVGDARAVLSELAANVGDSHVDDRYAAHVVELQDAWREERARLIRLNRDRPTQAQIIDAINRSAEPRDVLVGAAGSMPAEMQKVWDARDPKSFHLEYGYSCMGYEISGGIGCKMADPSREVYVLVGDGSYQMMPGEVATAVQEGVKVILVIVNNNGYGSIRSISERLGTGDYGTRFRYRESSSGGLTGDIVPVDLAANVRSLGAPAVECRTMQELEHALLDARSVSTTTAIVIDAHPTELVPSYETWWDVPIAEVSEMDSVRTVRAAYEERRAQERFFAPQRGTADHDGTRPIRPTI